VVKVTAHQLLVENESIWFLASSNRALDDSAYEPYLDTAESAILIRPVNPAEVYFCLPPGEDGASGDAMLALGHERLVFAPYGKQAPTEEQRRFRQVCDELPDEADEIVSSFFMWAQNQTGGVSLDQLVSYFLSRPAEWLLGVDPQSASLSSLPDPIREEGAASLADAKILWFDLRPSG
jgi:hypothetical protein